MITTFKDKKLIKNFLNNLKMESDKKFHDIIFVICPKYLDDPKPCKICGEPKNESAVCRKCRSRESSFSRVRTVLLRAFKKLNIDAEKAPAILKEERDKIYKDVPDRKEKIIVI
jgi:hypothetical protein